MTWYKPSYRHIRTPNLLVVGLVAGMCLPPPAAAQETLQNRYQSAIQSFNQARMEDACDLFQQIEKESPGYKETRTYLNPACATVKQAYALEETLFNEAVALLKQEHFDEAKQKFTHANNLALKRPKYRTQIDGYLKQIETRSREEALYQAAVQLFNDGKEEEAAKQFGQIEQAKGMRADDSRGYLRRIKEHREDVTWSRAVDLFAKNDLSDAQGLFEELVRANGKRAAEAQEYLVRIAAATSSQQTFEEGVKLFNAKRYSDATARFQQLIQNGGRQAAEARSYLQRIDALTKQEVAAQEQAKKKVAETGQDPK